MNVYRQYIDAVEPYYPLMSVYGDSSVVFYKTKYITNQKPFVPRIQGNNYPILKDCLAQDVKTGNMLSVFRQVKIDKSKYRLLLEEVPENTEALDWYEVTETWGYTPSSEFKSSVITSWTLPEFKPPLNEGIVLNIKYAIVNDDYTTTLTIDNADGKVVNGSILDLRSSQYNTGEEETQQTLYQKADNALVKEATSISAIIKPFEWGIYDISGGYKWSVQSFAYGSAFNMGISISATLCGKYKMMSLLDTDDYNKTHIVAVENSDETFKDGDLVVFVKDYWEYMLLWYYKQVSDPVRIYKAYPDRIIVPYFTWNVDNGSYSSTINSDSESSGFYVQGDKYVYSIGECRSAWDSDFAGTQIINFDTKLEPNDKWSPRSGNQIVSYLSYYTTPTLEEYKQMISRKDMVLAQPQIYEHFMGDIYKRTSVYIECQ